MSIRVDGFAPLIQVFDMPTSVRFYRDVLGFTVVGQSGPGDNFDWGMLRLGDAVMMLNTVYEHDSRPAAPDPARVDAHGDTGLFFGCPDVDATYEYLRNRGVTITPPTVAPYGMSESSGSR